MYSNGPNVKTGFYIEHNTLIQNFLIPIYVNTIMNRNIYKYKTILLVNKYK